MRDWWLRRLVLAHGASVVGEWAVTVGVLVHAFTWGGGRAVGITSIAILAPPLVGAPVVASAVTRVRPHALRAVGFGLQVLGYGGAALAALLGAPTPLVAVPAVVGLSATTVIHPTGAVLLPVVARSAGQLVASNLWITTLDSVAAFVGSLAAGVVVGLAGPQTVLAAACGLAVLGLFATVWRPAPLGRTARPSPASQPGAMVRQALSEMRLRPWSRGVLAVASARNLIVGGFDVVLVVLALEVLRLNEGGPGYLSALVGIGSLISTLTTPAVVRRSKLHGALMAAIVIAAVLAVVVGWRTSAPVVYLGLPVMGMCMASMDSLSRMLLQRSSDPRQLGQLFATVGFVAGLGQVTGSVLAQVALSVGGVRLALVALGVFLTALAVMSVASLRRADAHAAVPVADMALLANVPLFSAIPSSALERVARLADTVTVAAGQHVAEEGAPGGACFVVIDGEFDVTSAGGRRRLATRGDSVGEAALLARVPHQSTVTARRLGSVLQITKDPFVAALTATDVGTAAGPTDLVAARGRFRNTMTALRSDPRASQRDRADLWLGMGAAGRLLGDPSYTDAVATAAALGRSSNDNAAVAQAAALSTWPGAFFFIAERPDTQLIELCESALTLLPADDPLRARVLATLASHLTFGAPAEQRSALIAEATRVAALHDDPLLMSAVLNAEFICLWEPATLARRAEIAERLEEIATDVDDAELAYVGGFFGAVCAAEQCELDEARRRLGELAIVAGRAGNEYFDFLCRRLLLSIDVVCGVPGVGERIDELARTYASSHADTDGTWALHQGALAYQAGTVGQLVPMIEQMVRGPHSGTWPAALALAQLRSGDVPAAAATLAAQGDVPRNYFWITVAQVQAEVAAEMGALERCAALFEQLMPFADQLGVTASGSLCFGLVRRSLGHLALALGRLDKAIELLDAAVEAADRCGMPFEAVLCRRLLATAYRDAGEAERAREVASVALVGAAAGSFAGEQMALAQLARHLPQPPTD